MSSDAPDRMRETLARIASIDPYNLGPVDESCPSREAQLWAILNGVVSWAREAVPASGGESA